MILLFPAEQLGDSLDTCRCNQSIHRARYLTDNRNMSNHEQQTEETENRADHLVCMVSRQFFFYLWFNIFFNSTSCATHNHRRSSVALQVPTGLCSSMLKVNGVLYLM